MSTIIKAGQAGTGLRSAPARVELADHLAQARQAAHDAKVRAEAILAGAKAEAERLTAGARKDGYAAGFAEGQQDGHREGLESGAAAGRKEAFASAVEEFRMQHSAIVADALRIIEAVQAERDTLRVAARQHLLEFAIHLTRKLTYAIGVNGRETATANFERALQLVQDRTRLTVRVNPADAAAMQTFADTVLMQMAAVEAVKWVQDSSIAPGGCVVANESTTVDATLETQLEALVSLLMTGDGPGRADMSPRSTPLVRPWGEEAGRG